MNGVRAWLGVACVCVLATVGCFGRSSSGTAAYGAMCKVNVDCPADQFCVSGVCSQPGTTMMGGKCTAARDCAGGGCSATAAARARWAVRSRRVTTARCADDAAPSGGATSRASSGRAAWRAAPSHADRTASSDCLRGPRVRRHEARASRPAQAYPPFPGVKCEDDGPFRVYVEVLRPGMRQGLLSPAVPERRPRHRRRARPDRLRSRDRRYSASISAQLHVDAWVTDLDFSSIGVTTFRFSGDID